MSGRAGRPLAPWKWIGVPALLCLAATVLLGVPLRFWGLSLPEPIFPMAALFAWAIIRPSLLAPFTVLALGLFLDLYYGTALGLWALSLLIAYCAAFVSRNLLVGQGRAVLWIWYAGLTALAVGAAWLFSLMDVRTPASAMGALWQTLATIALYPAADRLIERFEDEAPRFG